MELFESASRNKYRYKTTQGQLSTEDLWDLSLVSLNSVAVALNKQIKELGEESFIEAKPKASKALDEQFEIVKHVIAYKIAQKEAKEKAIIQAEKRAQIKELISKKENETLAGKTLEELQKELEATYA